ncbi:hypothetical protein [Saccharothrix longispora]|uniref:hypothetical protein n=1 Tax=Saccharothrix longispora TaxID=33920 RepID=UPI0028FDACE2|nr:hypothetical protein [Saccharothrix longispora]MBY8852910.1 hypothetical protein [Saccharothrix sp. MB29]MDU0288978.1 hypothetical protein [Saccharothrix longispora]
MPPPVRHAPHLRIRAPDTSTLEPAGRPPLGGVRRRTVAALLVALDADLLDDVLLVVDELVANAYDHTGVPIDCTCWSPTSRCASRSKTARWSCPCRPVDRPPRP